MCKLCGNFVISIKCNCPKERVCNNKMFLQGHSNGYPKHIFWSGDGPKDLTLIAIVTKHGVRINLG